jgi:hypothetical protein
MATKALPAHTGSGYEMTSDCVRRQAEYTRRVFRRAE